MKRTRRWRIAALLLTFLLLIAGCAPADRPQSTAPSQIDSERALPVFSEFEYVRPDLAALHDWMDTLLMSMRGVSTAREAYELYSKESELLENFLNMTTVAMLRSSGDLTDAFYAAEYELLSEASVELELRRTEIIRVMLEAPYAAELENYLTAVELADLREAAALTDPKAEALLQRENDLIQQYTETIGTAAIEVEGESVSLDALAQMTDLSAEEYWAYVEEFFTRYNREIGELYLELIAVRDELANLLGFESFVELGYLRMGRTAYSCEEVLRLRLSIQNYASAYYNRLADAAFEAGSVDLLGSPEPVPLTDYKDTLTAFRTMCAALSSEAGACAEQLFAYGLTDLAERENKDVSTFTSYLHAYQAPFIFAHLTGHRASDIHALTHEFGHAFAYYLQGQHAGPDLGASFDVAEIFSTTMELLALPHYELFYGTEADLAQRYALLGMMESMISAAVYDEFNERVYTELPQTVAEINTLYDEVMQQYLGNRLSAAYNTSCDGRYWIMIPHFFSTPFYSIDYALADLTALQLWETACTDPETGFERYRSLILSADEKDFIELLELAKLKSPFDDKVVKGLIERLAEAIGR